MNTRNIILRFIRKATIEWHQDESIKSKVSLRQYLGMNNDEYDEFLNDEDNIFEIMLKQKTIEEEEWKTQPTTHM